MKTYTESDPKFSDSIQITETTDPAHADNINAAPKQLLQNTLALRKQAGELNENLALHTHAWSAITSKPNTFPASAHTHDDRYYTESEMDIKLSGKSNTSHNHDGRYYTEEEVNRGYYSLKDATEIPAGADLNSYAGFGNYVSTNAARSKTLKNCPWTDSGFKLIVARITGDTTGDYFEQRIIPNADECIEIIRHYVVGKGYTAWKRLIPGEYLPLSGGKLLSVRLKGGTSVTLKPG